MVCLGTDECGRLDHPAMASRRLNDRIQLLCEEAIRTEEGPELHRVFQELQTALSEHNSRLRNNALNPIKNRRLSIEPQHGPHRKGGGHPPWVL
jgi:hypothetical protein